MVSKRELERSRDAIATYLDIANSPEASYASQQGAWAGIRKELKKVGASQVTASDLVQITSKTVSDPNFRAAYLVNAAQRITHDERGRTPALLAELDNYRKHVRADGQRLFGAQRLRAAMNAYGPLVGWYAVLDDRTTSECRAMHGKNFDPYEPPAAGLPGITHVNCRCRPGPPHKELVPSSSVSTEDTDMAVELSDLNWSPRKNWVEKKGGLPPYVVRIAKHLIAKGFSRSHAIATAINVVKKMKRTGDLNWPGRQRVNAGSRGQAIGAVARWEAMKASREGDSSLELSLPSAVQKLRAKGVVNGGKREHGKSYGASKSSIGPGKHLNQNVTIGSKKPGSAPGSVTKAAKPGGLPSGGHVKKVTPGSAPSSGDVAKKMGVGRSAVKGRGPSDTKRVNVNKLADKLHNVPQPLPKHNLRPDVNIPGTVGAAPLKKAVAKQAAKGSASAAPAKQSHSGGQIAPMTTQRTADLVKQQLGVAPRSVNMAMPGAVVTSNTLRAKAMLKRLRKTYKPRKIKKIKTFKPTKVA